MKIYIQTLAATFLMVSSLFTQAQDGTIDPYFNAIDRNLGQGFSGEIHDLIIQDDGKPVAVGDFYSFDGKPCTGIARLTPQGYYDATFNSGTGFAYPNGLAGRKVLLLQPDGK